MQAVGTHRSRVWTARVLFLLPVSVLFFFFFIYPFLFTIYTSFTSWRGIGSMKFNGLANYPSSLETPPFGKPWETTLCGRFPKGSSKFRLPV
jgi:ABC-type sugar transport system permease subunit